MGNKSAKKGNKKNNKKRIQAPKKAGGCLLSFDDLRCLAKLQGTLGEQKKGKNGKQKCKKGQQKEDACSKKGGRTAPFI